MKQNVVFLTKLREDRGISNPSRSSWEYWCNKNNHKLFIHEGEHPWNNLFDVFDILEENNIEYNNIFVVNTSVGIISIYVPGPGANPFVNNWLATNILPRFFIPFTSSSLLGSFANLLGFFNSSNKALLMEFFI